MDDISSVKLKKEDISNLQKCIFCQKGRKSDSPTRTRHRRSKNITKTGKSSKRDSLTGLELLSNE